MVSPKRSTGVNPAFRNLMHGKMVFISSSGRTIVAWLYLGMPGVPWETSLPSDFQQPALVPKSQLLFPTQSIFLSGIIKLGSTHTNGARGQSLFNPLLSSYKYMKKRGKRG